MVEMGQEQKQRGGTAVPDRILFETSPIPMWEEDFTEVLSYIDGLQMNGVNDFHAYFEDHPQDLVDCIKLIKVLDVNKAAVELYHAPDKEALMADLSLVLPPEADSLFIDSLFALAEGAMFYECETQNRTLTGEIFDVKVQWALLPNIEGEQKKVILTFFDLTERNEAIKAAAQYSVRLKAMHQIGLDVLASQSPEAIANTATEWLLDMLPCRGAGVLLFDFQTNEAISLAGRFYDFDSFGRSPLAQWEIIDALKQGKTIYVEDASLIPNPSQDFEVMLAAGMRSFLTTPLLSQGDLLGNLNVVANKVFVFTEEDIEIIEQIGALLSCFSFRF